MATTKTLNLNDLARRITEREGGRFNLPIAQVKEVLSLALEMLADVPDATIRAAINRVVKSRARRKPKG